MTSISVVQYNTVYDMNILQQSASLNNNNNNERRDVIIIRKPQGLLQQPKKDDILLTNTARKKPRNSCKDLKTTSNPPPIAVARRNARERNRVKQVNNGFNNLRQHIPNSIAAAFETNNGRGGNKKLSKVDTLRMAVEYIRTLEDILASDDGERVSTSSISIVSYPSPAPSSPTLTTTTNSVYSYPLMSPSIDDDDLSTNPTPPPPIAQYVRINAGDSYQIISQNMYNSDSIDIDEQLLSESGLMDGGLEFGDVQELSLLNSIHSSSLSPEVYSDHSLSPKSLEKATNAQAYVPIYTSQMTPPADGVKFKVETVSPEDVRLRASVDVPAEHKENMLHVMSWWEQHQHQHQHQQQQQPTSSS